MEARRRGTRERKSILKGTEALEQEPDSEEEVAGKQRAEEEARKATVLRRRQGKLRQEATISPPTSDTSATISPPTSDTSAEGKEKKADPRKMCPHLRQKYGFVFWLFLFSFVSLCSTVILTKFLSNHGL
jgi:hypothetical protein